MSEKRKDHKGRILKTGESQRKDLTYMYRYTDLYNRRKCIYAPTLQELREKETQITVSAAHGFSSTNTKMTVAELIEFALQLKGNIRYSTQKSYASHLNWLKTEPFANRRVIDVKMSEAKALILKLQETGYGFWTIHARYCLLKSAFNVAIEDDIIFKNPFNFVLRRVIQVKQGSRSALTLDEQDGFLQFIANSGCYSKYLDEIQILLGTGLRISEFCGLTIDNIEFDKKRIHVEKQLGVREGSTCVFTDLKTDAGNRYLPMSDEVYAALVRVVSRRKKNQMAYLIDGRNDLLFIRKNGTPRRPQCYQKHLQNIQNAYNRTTGSSLVVTPHVLRHTFCTNMMRAGIDVKVRQYLMGHTSVDMTVNTYTHATWEDAEHAFQSQRKAI